MKAIKKNLEDYKAIKKMKKIARQELRRRGIKKISFRYKGKLYSSISKNYTIDDEDVFCLVGEEIMYFDNPPSVLEECFSIPAPSTNNILVDNEVVFPLRDEVMFTERLLRYTDKKMKKN